MIFDLLQAAPRGDEMADVCIVGAGAAGIALAVELQRSGKRVVVLDGGGREVEEQAQEPYRSEVVGHVHRGVNTGRFRAYGGTTTRWGGQILELDPEDFERRAWIPESGWPFAKAELAPFYQRALELEGVSGAIQEDADVWRALGLAQPSFAAMKPYFSRWCPEPNFARLHGRALEGEGISVWLHANVVEMLLDGDVVRAVRCRTQTGREASFHAREFVFCMGSIECVRFFLQPRNGGLPWNASGLLGKHFHDHVDANAGVVLPRDRRRFAEVFDNVFLGGYKYHPKLRLDPVEQERDGLLNSAATVTFETDVDEVLGSSKAMAKAMLRGRFGDVKAAEVAGLLRHTPLLAKQTLRYALRHRVYNPSSAMVRLRVHCEQPPDSASTITLAEERDSLGLLRTRLDWRISKLEVQTIRRFAEIAQKSLAELAKLEIDGDLLENGSAFVAKCDDSNHHMGGMRMSASASNGVVSPDLLLHGTKNCFICSGAVFPTSGFSNPTHTVLALAMRLARRLTKV
jgi:choline dehydrogenase-like flavoprotein